MIVISPLTAGDSIVINEKSESKLYDVMARVSRSKTLDSGVVIDHRGVVAGDRTLQIKCDLTEAEETTLRTLFENQTIVYISTKDGFYSGAIERLRGDDGAVEFSFLIKAGA